MILFLDFDGVLHPDEVYWYRQHGIVLRTDLLPPEFANHTLFGYSPILEDLLVGFPSVRIILSTSWVPTLDYRTARVRLPVSLQNRVIASTFHTQHTPYWHWQTRFQQIITCAEYRKLGDQWLAIDNDADGWPDDQRHHLVLTDDNLGISDPQTQAELRSKLTVLTANT